MTKLRRYPNLRYINVELAANRIGREMLTLKAAQWRNEDGKVDTKYPYYLELGCFSIRLDDDDLDALRQTLTELPKLP